MKITFKELNEKRKILLHLIANEEEMSKIKYAVLKWDKEVSKILSEIQAEYTDKFAELKEEKEIFYAIEKDGILLKKDDKYQYNKENSILLSKELFSIKKQIENELANHIIDFEPYILKDEAVINQLDVFAKEELKNIFI
jgi:hypothetical protein